MVIECVISTAKPPGLTILLNYPSHIIACSRARSSSTFLPSYCSPMQPILSQFHQK